MKPTLFHLGAGLPIHSYGFSIAVGMVLGVALAVRRGRQVGIPTAFSLDLTFYAIVFGLAGSRLLYVLVHATDYVRVCRGFGATRSFGRVLRDCTAPLHFWQGGLVFLGGALLAATVVLVFARRKGLALGDVADVLAPSVSLAHVFGRLGCFLVGCCYGKPWAGGAHFPPDSVAYSELLARHAFSANATFTPGLHPTQLYESAGELLIFIGLLLLWRRRNFPGVVALGYAFAYGVLRLFVEIFRDDEARGFLVELRLPRLANALGLPPADPLFLSTAQATSLALIAGAVLAYVLLGRRSRKRARSPEKDRVSGS
jgi:phosphatidylglycerol---prolipoprotein diacylglyceryl transferase